MAIYTLENTPTAFFILSKMFILHYLRNLVESGEWMNECINDKVVMAKMIKKLCFWQPIFIWHISLVILLHDLRSFVLV